MFEYKSPRCWYVSQAQPGRLASASLSSASAIASIGRTRRCGRRGPHERLVPCADGEIGASPSGLSAAAPTQRASWARGDRCRGEPRSGDLRLRHGLAPPRRRSSVSAARKRACAGDGGFRSRSFSSAIAARRSRLDPGQRHVATRVHWRLPRRDFAALGGRASPAARASPLGNSCITPTLRTS